MYCPKCNNYTPDDSLFCTSCGVDIKNFSSVPLCPKCNLPIKEGHNYCVGCGYPLTQTALAEKKRQQDLKQQEFQLKMQMASLKAQEEQLSIQQEQFSIQQEQLRVQHAQYSSMLKCPKCGSSSISGQKKGYGVVKGVAGAAIGSVVAAPLAIVGLAAGNIGRKKIRCTCMNCGYHFKAGRK